MTITSPGTVVENKDIHGWVKIRAANVTIRNSIIRGGKAPIQYDSAGRALARGNRAIVDVTDSAATGFVLQDSSLVPEFPSVLIDGIRGSNFTLRRVAVSGTTDGIKVHGVGKVRVEDSHIYGLRHWSFDPYQSNGSHADGIQVLSGRNIVLVGNRIGMSGGSATSPGQWNAAIQVTQDNGAVSNVQVDRNWLDGGHCTVNVNAKPLASISGVAIKDNRFGRTTKYRNCSVVATKATIAFSGNTYIDGALPAPKIGS